MVEIPIHSNKSHYTFDTVIEDKELSFKLRFNTRMNRWIMDILDIAQDPIFTGIPVHINLDLLGNFYDKRFPKGMLIAKNFTDKNVEPTRENLGTDVKLFFIPKNEVADVE